MATPELTTVQYYPGSDPRRRLFALWYFCPLLILWTILGHTVLGFEQSWAHPVAAVATAILVQMLLDAVDAWAKRRPVRFLDGWAAFVNFLPPAIIPALACAMLLYPNDRLLPVVFAAALSVASKVIFRAPVGKGRTQHIFNPSNLGIAVTLLLFPWVGFAPPYHFTKNLIGAWHWVVPGVVLVSGSVIHALFTGRLPLCLAWVGGFVAQGALRSWFFGTPLVAPLVPMTSAAFILFTLYMIPDPATTPIKPWRQVAFGLATAAAYGILQVCHVVFGLFFALVIVSALRGVGLYLIAGLEKLRGAAVGLPAPVYVSRPEVPAGREA
jgi:hypothetical protein